MTQRPMNADTPLEGEQVIQCRLPGDRRRALGLEESPGLALTLLSYMQAVAYAGAFELHARLIAEQQPVLRERAPNADLGGLLDDLLKLNPKCSDADVKAIKGCAKLRNNLLHLRLSKGRGRLESLGQQIESVGVLSIHLATGDVSVVAETSTETSGVHGWLLESGGSGDFGRVIDVFLEGLNALRRVRDDIAGRASGVLPGENGGGK